MWLEANVAGAQVSTMQRLPSIRAFEDLWMEVERAVVFTIQNLASIYKEAKKVGAFEWIK